MRVVIFAVMILFVSSSANAQNNRVTTYIDSVQRETDRINVIGDSLIALSKIIHKVELEFFSYNKMLVEEMYSATSNQEFEYQKKLTHKEKAIAKYLKEMQNCRSLLINSAYFLYAYAEGARWSSCQGIKWNYQSLDFAVDRWLRYSDLYDTRTSQEKKYKSMRKVVKRALLYIRDNLPDDCTLDKD